MTSPSPPTNNPTIVEEEDDVQLRDSIMQSLEEGDGEKDINLILEEDDKKEASKEEEGKKKAADDDELVELEPALCFCGQLNCEHESHQAKGSSTAAAAGGSSSTSTSEACNKTDGCCAPPSKKSKTSDNNSCCDQEEDEESQFEDANEKMAGDKPPETTTKPAPPTPTCCDGADEMMEVAKCDCGQMDCDGSHHEEPKGKDKGTSAAGASCCDSKDPSKETPSTTPAKKVDSAAATAAKDCCNSKCCICGQLDCDGESHVKQCSKSSPAQEEPQKKKEPYKVKMNIHQRWNNLFEKLKAFYLQHRTWQIPRSHPDKSLDRWVNRQRSTYHRGQLKPKRQAALDAIGFDWGKPPKHKGDTWITTKPWHERFQQLMEFKEWHGHCKVPTKYEDDPSLNRWVWKQQREYAKGKLTKEQIKCLKSLGVSWIPSKGAVKRKRDSGDEKYEDCAEEEEDDDEEEDDEEESDEEEVVGAVAIPIIKSSWELAFDNLLKFKEECGHTNVTTKHDKELGTWAQRQRTHYRQKSLHPERIKKLESIGFQWRAAHANFVPRTWKDQYYMLKKFKEEHNHVNVPVDYANDKMLARWVQHQRRDKKNGALTQDKINQLEALGGFDWEGPGAEMAPATKNSYTRRNSKAANNTINSEASIPMETQQQLAMAQQKALARQYEDLTQQQAIATQQQAFLQQQDAYTAMTAHQQYGFAQQQRQAVGPGRLTEAEEARRALEHISDAAEARRAMELNCLRPLSYPAYAPPPPWQPGWGWNSRGEMVWCGGGPGTAPPAAGAAATPAVTVATATPPPATGAMPPAGTATPGEKPAATATPGEKPTTSTATPTAPAATATTGTNTTPAATTATIDATVRATAAESPNNATNTATAAPATTKNPTAEQTRIQELEQANAKLQEENLQLRQEKLELMRENTSLQATIEEAQQAHLKEKKTLHEQVEENSSQLQQQATQTKAQGDQMAQLMKQVLEMKELMDNKPKDDDKKE